MRFIAAANDIRPNWPLRQLAELVPAGSFDLVTGVDHNFWTTDPDRWTEIATEAVQTVNSTTAIRSGPSQIT
jgi:proline iminopeptidase